MVDFLLAAKRNLAAARRFLERAINLHDLPAKITRTIWPSNALRAPMPGFKTFRCARIIIAGIETMHMIRKGPLDCPVGQAMFSADQFYTLAI